MKSQLKSQGRSNADILILYYASIWHVFWTRLLTWDDGAKQAAYAPQPPVLGIVVCLMTYTMGFSFIFAHSLLGLLPHQDLQPLPLSLNHHPTSGFFSQEFHLAQHQAIPNHQALEHTF